ncbi:cell envelope-related transcriptional attenuator [Cellulomonas fimi ATCC 484]|uniref:Cell envelope-related transcriptional attenuator n=1 Tax=Cellulomonas fimi (strain ATCC 484 / DSM 20113 / JCM 1341 / CCUG 24087 / LMG 16345 / NBRC 15513 / NCIMB 8980 / NCTC 7547 / NRS-133) TaxID=590998 RepID=F4H538_CELFA|nr:cell envelope-related transcriptional attenuator [Cellulomonas fimi ATCC 484]VEH33758.1 Regulatory protein msrR [Cellulomonas fimi]
MRPHHALRNVALVTTAILAFGVTGAAATVQKLQGNIDRVDVSDLVGAAPKPSVTTTPDPDDPNAGMPVNILVLGSDQRDGVNAEIAGAVAGMRSDTAIVVHISADRQRVELVSIPRDSLVDIPSCQMSNGKTSRAKTAMFNEAFATGWDMGGDMASAAACTIRTVQENTGVPIDHFVVVDFSGFQSMIDAIGGVPICIPNDMKDSYSGLDLKAGNQVLNGPAALAFARARHGKGVGDGSDINRIGNQQRLAAAIVQTVLSKNVLTDVPQLVGFLNAATSSLTTDSEFSSSAMVGLAYNMRSISSGNITFMTVPWAPAKSDPNRVEWTSAAATMWGNIAADLPALGTPEVPATPTAPTTTAPTAGATQAPPVAETPVTPTPTETKKAGREAFTAGDTTAVCG